MLISIRSSSKPIKQCFLSPTKEIDDCKHHLIRLPILPRTQFLWPFQSFSNSKGHRLLVDHGLDLQYAFEQLESDDQPASELDLNVEGNVTVLGDGMYTFQWRRADKVRRR